MMVFYKGGGGGGTEFFSFQITNTTYFKIDFAACAIGELAFVQYLKKDHNDVLHIMRMYVKAAMKKQTL